MNTTYYKISLFLLLLTTFYLSNDRVKASVSLWIYFSVVLIASIYFYKNIDSEFKLHSIVLILFCVINIILLQTNKLTTISCCNTNLYYKRINNEYVVYDEIESCKADVVCNCPQPSVVDGFYGKSTTVPTVVPTVPTVVPTVPVQPAVNDCSTGETINQTGWTIFFQIVSGISILLFILNK